MPDGARPLQGRVALVCGGSSGIGRAGALRLAAAGADVAIVARDSGRARELVQQLTGLGVRAVHLAADLADPASVDQIRTGMEREFGPPDVLVASGSGPNVPARPFAEMPPTTFPDYFVGNLWTRLHAIASVLPAMRERGYGKIIVITSEGGRTPTPGESLFGASAAGAMFAVRALARELAPDGIRINALSLTLTRDTPTHERLSDGTMHSETLARALAKVESRSPLGLSSAADVAEAILFLSTPASDKMTGATLPLTAGLTV